MPNLACTTPSARPTLHAPSTKGALVWMRASPAYHSSRRQRHAPNAAAAATALGRRTCATTSAHGKARRSGKLHAGLKLLEPRLQASPRLEPCFTGLLSFTHDAGAMHETPRWFKVVAIVLAALVVLLVVGLLIGGGKHGPGRHARPGAAAGESPATSTDAGVGGPARPPCGRSIGLALLGAPGLPSLGAGARVMMSSRVRKLELTVHVATTLGWLGAVVSFLVLALAPLVSEDAQLVRGALLSME